MKCRRGEESNRSLRLRLHSGLRQSGAPSAWHSFGTPKGVPFQFCGLVGLVGGCEIELEGDVLAAFAEALGVFVALEPAVDAGLGRVAALHVEDDFGAGVGFAAVVDKLVGAFAGFHWRLG
jgi:hypothetical protein